MHYCFFCLLFPFLGPWSNVMCVQLRLCYLLVSTTKDMKEIGTPAGFVASSGRNLDQGRYCVGVIAPSRCARCCKPPWPRCCSASISGGTGAWKSCCLWHVTSHCSQTCARGLACCQKLLTGFHTKQEQGRLIGMETGKQELGENSGVNAPEVSKSGMAESRATLFSESCSISTVGYLIKISSFL